MEVIVRGRRSGKTTELIKLAAENFNYIVCRNHQSADMIAKQAREMGLDIPHPITFRELRDKRFSGRGMKGLMIDDADLLLQELAGAVPVEAVVIAKDRWLSYEERIAQAQAHSKSVEKFINVADMRGFELLVRKGDISYTRMIELINEKADIYYSELASTVSKKV